MREHEIAQSLSRLNLGRLIPERGPLIVMYHGIAGEDGVTQSAFEVQLDLLAARRDIVPLAEAIEALGTPAAARLASITFDDGYVDFGDLALPVLRRKGFHATLFVPAGLVGRSNEWDHGRAERRNILDANALRTLDSSHVTIGAHGLTHCRLASLDTSRLRREIRDSRTILEDVCGTNVRLFAYPYGQRDDFDARAMEAVRKAGYSAACSTCFGRGSFPAQRFALRRVGIESQDTPEIVERKLDGYYDWMAFKESAGALLRRGRARASQRNSVRHPE